MPRVMTRAGRLRMTGMGSRVAGPASAAVLREEANAFLPIEAEPPRGGEAGLPMLQGGGEIV